MTTREEYGQFVGCLRHERCHSALDEIEALRELLRDVRYRSGVELDDSRLGYVLVQVDREAWDTIGLIIPGERK